ncbi:hypothetical protein EDB86DRAFT_2970897 [Lactarius hatsudake]|nr:hypothetical protein EDB86DRAFT_2970897 [Lactarius hatsudake]
MCVAAMARCVSSVLTTSVLGSPVLAAVARCISSVLKMPVLGSPVLAAVACCVSSVLTTPVLGSPLIIITDHLALCKFSPMFPHPNISLLPKVTQTMSLPAVQNLTRTRLGDYHLIFGISLYHF